MGMQTPCGIHSEELSQSDLQGTDEVSGGGFPVAYRAEGKLSGVEACDARPCAHVAERAAEIRDVSSFGLLCFDGG